MTTPMADDKIALMFQGKGSSAIAFVDKVISWTEANPPARFAKARDLHRTATKRFGEMLPDSFGAWLHLNGVQIDHTQLAAFSAFLKESGYVGNTWILDNGSFVEWLMHEPFNTQLIGQRHTYRFVYKRGFV